MNEQEKLALRDQEILELVAERAEMRQRMDALEALLQKNTVGTGIYLGGLQESYREYAEKTMKNKDRGDNHGE